MISIPYILYIIWILISTIICLKIYTKIKVFTNKTPLLIVSLLFIAIYFIGENYRFGVFNRRLPYSIVNAIKEYSKKENTTYNTIKGELFSLSENMNVIFVLGETVRADHLGINGYGKETTPNLQKQENIISFPNVFTPLTYTAISLPQILTNASIKDTLSTNNTILYSVLNEANIETSWIGNQSLEKSYELIVKENKRVVLIDPFHSVLSFKKQKDEKLIEILDTIKFTNNKTFTTLHMIGSHWFYNSRYTDKHKKFKPTADSKFLKSSTNEELINSYDNTIVYLVNTGWSGGAYGVGKRISIKYSRAMVTAALAGAFDIVKFRHDNVFNLDVPLECPGVPSDVLDPKNTWFDKDSYDLSAKKLAQMFVDNFTKFVDISDDIRTAGPQLSNS